MNKEEIKKYIDYKLEEYLKNKNALKNEDVESLLYNYCRYIAKIKILKNKLEEIEKVNFTILKNNSIDNERVQGTSIYKSDLDCIEDEKEKINKKIGKLNYIVNQINLAISVIEDDEYYTIIEYRYLKGYSINKVLEELHITNSTFKRNKKRLLKQIRSILFL